MGHVVFLAFALGSPTPPSLHVTFLGNAAFAITDGASTLYTDETFSVEPAVRD